jgi:hypothetical protein
MTTDSADRDTWEMEGRFWLPGSDEKRYGRIRWTRGQALVLEIPDGPLIATDLDDNEVAVDAVLGESLGGLPFPRSLLDGAAVRPTTISLATADKSTLVFSTLLRGIHAISESEVTATFARVAVHGLDDFLLGGRVDDKATLHVTAENPGNDHINIEMPWGSISLWADSKLASWQARGREVTHRVVAWAQFDFHAEISLAEVDGYVQPLVDLVAFATRRPSELASLSLDRPRSAEDGLDRGHYEVVRPERQATDIRVGGRPSYLLLNLGYADNPAATIRGWYELRDRVGEVWPLFFDTAILPVTEGPSLLVNLTTFAEGYHRQIHDQPALPKARARAAVKSMLAALEGDDELVAHYKDRLVHTEQQTQRQRLQDLTYNSLSLLTAWDLDAETFVTQVVQTRNWLTHWGTRGSQVQDGEALDLLNHRLYTILVANILLDCGLDDDEVVSTLGSGFRGIGLP